MIVSVQFDLTKSIDAELFALVTSRKGCAQAERSVSEAPSIDEALEFPLKKDLPGPSIVDIQVRFKKCQDKDASAAKELMKGFLTHHNCKAVKDLDDDQRLALMADLDDFLGE